MDSIVTVKDIKPEEIIVSCSGTACEGCHSSLFCRNKDNSFSVANPEKIEIHEGDTVKLSLPTKRSIASTFMTLGLPLLCFFAGMLIAFVLGKSEKLQFLFAFIALALGFLISYIYFRITKQKYIPKIKEKLEE